MPLSYLWKKSAKNDNVSWLVPTELEKLTKTTTCHFTHFFCMD